MSGTRKELKISENLHSSCAGKRMVPMQARLFRRIAMVTSIILINAQKSRINTIAEQLQSFPEISEVYSVSGKLDLIAIVRVATNDDLALLVTKKMVDIEGIEKTETMLAFKAYSRHDLESMFSLGM